jgi:concanavalin A-like lectin/glucanase superfamily protein
MSMEAMIFALNANTSSSTLLDGLACYWKLDEDLKDSAGNNDAMDVLGVSFDAGIIGPGIWFGGYSDLWLDRNPHEGSGSFSIFAWIKTFSGGFGPILSYGNFYGSNQGFCFCLEEDNTIALLTKPGIVTSSGEPIPLGEWCHVGVVYNAPAGKAQIYMNGEMSGIAAPYSPAISGGSARIASLNDAAYFPDNIDEIGVWTKALTSDEITELYHGGAGKTYPF